MVASPFASGRESEYRDNMLTTGDVAGIFNVHPGTIRRWCRQGKIFAYRIGSRGERRFRHEDVAVAYFDMSIQKYLKFNPAQL